MKLSNCLIAAAILVFNSCKSTSDPKDQKADILTTTLSPEAKKIKRENDIKAAVNNQELIVGEWSLTGADSADIKIDNLSEIPFSKLAFYKDFTFKYFRGAAFVNSGTYEWIADNREMILTTENGEGHLLIRKLDKKNLVTTDLPLKLYFNRIK